MTPLVSIVMPVYNVEQYIEECLLSVINQTYQNLELVIVNDETKDKSKEIAQNLLKGWNGKWMIIDQENAGACAARNNALSHVTGDYVLHLDSDDKIDLGMISEMISTLRTFNFAEDVVCIGKWEGLEGNNKSSATILQRCYETPTDLLLDLYMNHVCLYPHCYMVPKAIINKSGEWDLNVVIDQDGDYFSRIIINTKRIVYSSKAVAYYRFNNSGSQSKKISERTIMGYVDTAIKKADLLLQNSENPNKLSAVYELVSLKPISYYPYFSKARKKAEKYIKSHTNKKGIEYPHISWKQWVYYYLVKTGLKKSVLVP